MNQVHYLIDVNKIDCGKVGSVLLSTFPQSLLILRSFIPKIGHLYFALTWSSGRLSSGRCQVVVCQDKVEMSPFLQSRDVLFWDLSTLVKLVF